MNCSDQWGGLEWVEAKESLQQWFKYSPCCVIEAKWRVYTDQSNQQKQQDHEKCAVLLFFFFIKKLHKNENQMQLYLPETGNELNKFKSRKKWQKKKII